MTIAKTSSYPSWVEGKLPWGSPKVPLTLDQLDSVFTTLNRIRFEDFTPPTLLERGQLNVTRTVYYLAAKVFCIFSEVDPFSKGARKSCYRAVLLNLEKETAHPVALLSFKECNVVRCAIQAWITMAPLLSQYIKIFHIEEFPALSRKIIVQELFDIDAFDSELGDNEAIEVAHQIAEQLEKFHENGLAHRDIKAENIVLKKVDGAFKAALIDLEFVYVTGTLSFVGTLCLSSPELLVAYLDRNYTNNDIRRFSADIWALGLTFYEMRYKKMIWKSNLASEMNNLFQLLDTQLCGDRALTKETVLKIIKIMKESLPPVSNDPFIKLIASMVSINPSDRPSITAVKQQLALMLRREATPRSDSASSTPQQLESAATSCT